MSSHSAQRRLKHGADILRTAVQPMLCVAMIALAACNGAVPTPRATNPGHRSTSPFYARSSVRDLNADERADSVVLVADGPRPDSLRIALFLFVDGREAYREEWTSAYELVDVDDTVRVRPRLDAFMRGRLDAALASVELTPLDTSEVKLLADDPRVLESLVPRPTLQLGFSFGYETAVALAWDASRRRFVRLWRCC